MRRVFFIKNTNGHSKYSTNAAIMMAFFAKNNSNNKIMLNNNNNTTRIHKSFFSSSSSAEPNSQLQTPNVLTLPSKVRNIGVIAHVDHGKTTLVDKLLATALGKSEDAETQSGESERLMDSMELEQERGITIMSKATRVDWKGHTINIVDTPGHADFGGEVERILTMVDSVVLLCDATEGPMAQTKFVLNRSLQRGLKPMTILNKADRPTARLDGSTESELFDLFAALDATDEQLDYPTLYASAIKNWVTDDPDQAKDWADNPIDVKQGMEMILDQIIEHAPALPEENDMNILNEPFALAVNNIGKDPYVGSLATGKIHSGTIGVGDMMRTLERGTTSLSATDNENDNNNNNKSTSKVVALFVNRGTTREQLKDTDRVGAGDIITVAGIDANVGDTITNAINGTPNALETPPLTPPTVSMTFSTNTSPLQGREGSIVTSSKIKERLLYETDNNITITVEPQGEQCEVFARGELQLGILIEQMRREDYEFCVSPPKIVMDENNMEPYLEVIVDVDSEFSGTVINGLTGGRKGALIEMDENESDNRARLLFHVPARGLLGFGPEIATLTHGSAIVNHLFLEMRPFAGQLGDDLNKGKLVATESGKTSSYGLNLIQARGELFVEPGVDVYEGMVIGENARDGDLDVNPCKGKALTNMRTQLKDEAIKLVPPRARSVEEYITYMGEDEMLEVTPLNIRLRKNLLDQGERFRYKRDKKNAKQSGNNNNSGKKKKK